MINPTPEILALLAPFSPAMQKRILKDAYQVLVDEQVLPSYCCNCECPDRCICEFNPILVEALELEQVRLMVNNYSKYF